MKKSQIHVTKFGTNYMNDEQRYRFYRVLGKQLKEYEERLEKDRIETLRAMQEVHYIYSNYYRLGLDRRNKIG